jgi:hypothetical protein
MASHALVATGIDLYQLQGGFEMAKALTLKLSLNAVLVTVASLALAGCSTMAGPSASPSVTASPTPAVQPMTPAQAKAEFFKISKLSCDTAQNEGVVETSEDFTVVSVNKEDGYLDFSAAYFSPPDTYELIWELDGITACSDYYTMSMAEEAGQEAPIDVTFDETDSTYTTFEDFGEFGTSNYRFQIKDGKLDIAESIDPKNPRISTLRYGNITEADRLILKTAVDRFNEDR